MGNPGSKQKPPAEDKSINAKKIIVHEDFAKKVSDIALLRLGKRQTSLLAQHCSFNTKLFQTQYVL